MNQGIDQPPSPGEDTPYGRLKVASGASFDEVQAARQARLDEAGDDPMARAQIEAAYDAVLMARLKERQQGRVSTAAASASVLAFVSLVVGLLLGGLLAGVLDPQLPLGLPLNAVQIQGLPALVVLALVSLLLA